MLLPHDLTDIDPTYWPNWIRLASVLILTFSAIQVFMLLAHYWHYVMPLREEIGEGRIVAPPPGWTFSYHLCLLILLLFTIESRVELATANSQPTLGLFILPVLGVALAVVTTKFTHYYSENLRRATHPFRDRHRTDMQAHRFD